MGITAILVGLAVITLVVFAANSRDMSDAQFLIAAYSIATAIIAGYTVSLSNRLDRAWKNRDRPE